ncbi:MAG: hypothetical protein ACI4JY_10875 [Oscillospiraceae bacterium]
MVTRDIVVEDVLFDTVLSTAFIAYDEEKRKIEDVCLISDLGRTKQSSVQWTDIGQYGVCEHTCAIREYSALAELIKDKDWTWNSAHNALDIDRKSGNVAQELKDEVLKVMMGN